MCRLYKEFYKSLQDLKFRKHRIIKKFCRVINISNKESMTMKTKIFITIISILQ